MSEQKQIPKAEPIPEEEQGVSFSLDNLGESTKQQNDSEESTEEKAFTVPTRDWLEMIAKFNERTTTGRWVPKWENNTIIGAVKIWKEE